MWITRGRTSQASAKSQSRTMTNVCEEQQGTVNEGQQGEVRLERWQEQIVLGLMGHGEDSDFYSERQGSH